MIGKYLVYWGVGLEEWRKVYGVWWVEGVRREWEWVLRIEIFREMLGLEILGRFGVKSVRLVGSWYKVIGWNFYIFVLICFSRLYFFFYSF